MKPVYKILIALGIVGLAALGIFLGWRMITGVPEAGGPANPVPALPNVSVPVAKNSPLVQETTSSITAVKLSDGPVFDFWIVPEAGDAYYFTPDGLVWNAREGPDVQVSGQEIGALSSVTVNPKRDKALVAFGDPARPRWAVFDALDGFWSPLPPEVAYAVWGADGETLIGTVKKDRETNLVKIHMDSAGVKYAVLMRDFRLKDAELTPLSDDKIVVTERPSASYAGAVWVLNPKKATLEAALSPQSGFWARWSDDRKTVFIFSAEGGFSITNNDFELAMPVFFTTFPDKCSAKDGLAHCFAPKFLPDGAVLPDDYMKRKFFSADDLFRTDSAGNTAKLFSSGEGGLPSFDAVHPQAAKGDMYFINRYDDGLYRVAGLPVF